MQVMFVSFYNFPFVNFRALTGDALLSIVLHRTGLSGQANRHVSTYISRKQPKEQPYRRGLTQPKLTNKVRLLRSMAIGLMLQTPRLK